MVESYHLACRGSQPILSAAASWTAGTESVTVYNAQHDAGAFPVLSGPHHLCSSQGFAALNVLWWLSL